MQELFLVNFLAISGVVYGMIFINVPEPGLPQNNNTLDTMLPGIYFPTLHEYFREYP